MDTAAYQCIGVVMLCLSSGAMTAYSSSRFSGYSGGANRPRPVYGPPRPSTSYLPPGPPSTYGLPQRSSTFNQFSGSLGGNYDSDANYQFGYDVFAPDYGVSFGQQEQRQGDTVTGHYQVLLPDGRTQHVRYTADQQGYRPVITYQ